MLYDCQFQRLADEKVLQVQDVTVYAVQFECMLISKDDSCIMC